MTSFLQHLINSNFNLNPSYINNGWLEFDTTQDLNIYNDFQNKNKLYTII